MVLHGEFHSQATALVTGLFAADFRMMCHLGVIAIPLSGLGHVTVDDVRIFTMSHDGQRSGREDALQGLPAVDEHISRRRAHEQLDARDAVNIELGENVGIVVSGAEEEAIVHMTLRGSQGKLLIKRLKGGGLGHGIRHVEIGGDTSCRRSTTF